MISINWGTSVIYVPRADLTLVQSLPIEIREMNLNWFRLELKDLEDTENGMMFPNTHIHNTEVSLGGLTYARVIEILDPYTITFEDGQYAVNLVGANSNVGDKVNVNQVSVRSANSAGLTSSPAIEYASFNGGVSIDTSSSYTGTTYPVGTPQQPVNNLADAKLIAIFRGFSKLFIIGDIIIGATDVISNYELVGQGATLTVAKTTITLTDGCTTSNTSFANAKVIGKQNGESKYDNCIINAITNVHCRFDDCGMVGPISVVNSGWTVNHTCDLHNCYTGNSWFIVDFNASPITHIYSNFSGKIKYTNVSNASGHITIQLDSGEIWLDSTCTAGTIVVRGQGLLIDESNGASVDYSGLSPYSYLSEIRYASYNGEITIDANSVYTGSEYPMGTSLYPVNNLTDAVAVAVDKGFKNLFFIGDFTFDPTVNISNYILTGQGKEKSTFTFQNGSIVANCKACCAKLTGLVLGITGFEKCHLYNYGSSGAVPSSNTVVAESCLLEGELSLPSNFTGELLALNCWGVPDDSNNVPVLNMNNGNFNVSVRNYAGRLSIKNCNQAVDIRIFLISGGIDLQSSVTNGSFYFYGVGDLIDISTGTTLYAEGLINEQMNYNAAVHIDAINGVAGTYYGNGTLDNPVNNLADALTILAREGFSSIMVHGSLTITEDLSDVHIHGIQHVVDYEAGDTINLNGKVFTDVGFGYISLEGSMSAASTQLQYHNCYLKNVLNLTGSAEKCSMIGDNSILPGSYFSSVGMIFEGDYTTLDMQSTTGTTASLDIDSGYVEFLNSVTGCLIEVNMRGGEIELNASCTGGEFYAEGYGTLYGDPVALGMTVKENHLLALETIEDQVLDAQTTDHDTSGTVGKAITDAGTGGNPWAAVVEGTHTANDIMRFLLSFISGEATGAGTATVTFKSDDGLTNRIVMTVDDKGNRSSVVLDGSD